MVRPPIDPLRYLAVEAIGKVRTLLVATIAPVMSLSPAISRGSRPSGPRLVPSVKQLCHDNGNRDPLDLPLLRNV